MTEKIETTDNDHTQPQPAPTSQKVSAMTEHTENHRYIIDPVAFFAALIGAPLIFTAATFWLVFIPVGALIVGGLPYLVLGCPLLLIHLRRHAPDGSDIAWLAVVASTAPVGLGTLAAVLAPRGNHTEIISIGIATMAVSALFAAGWGATFAWLYKALARDFYIRAVTL